MSVAVIVSGLGLGLVAFLSLLDLRSIERKARARWARVEQASPERRCPFCHEDFELLDRVVFCIRCRAKHHSSCWEDHQGCSIYGCVPDDLIDSSEFELVDELDFEDQDPANSQPERGPLSAARG